MEGLTLGCDCGYVAGNGLGQPFIPVFNKAQGPPPNEPGGTFG